MSNLKKAPSISLGIVFHADSSVVYDVKRRRSSMAIEDRQRLVDRLLLGALTPRVSMIASRHFLTRTVARAATG